MTLLGFGYFLAWPQTDYSRMSSDLPFARCVIHLNSVLWVIDDSGFFSAGQMI